MCGRGNCITGPENKRFPSQPALDTLNHEPCMFMTALLLSGVRTVPALESTLFQRPGVHQCMCMRAGLYEGWVVAMVAMKMVMVMTMMTVTMILMMIVLTMIVTER